MNMTTDTKSFFKLGVPIMLQYMITASIGLVSSMMVGRLGDKAVVALGISNQIYFVYSLIILGLYSGTGVLISQLWGAKNIDSVKKSMALASIIGVGVGLVFLLAEKTMLTSITRLFTSDEEVLALVFKYMDSVILSYLILPIFLAISTGFRSTKRPMAPMLISLAAIILNIILCYGLIYGNLGMPNFGIGGAGLATIFSRIFEVTLILIIWIKSDLFFGFAVIKGISSRLITSVVRASTPVILNELCWGLGIVIYNILYGRIGLDALTAVQINSVILSFFVTIAFGFSGASAVVIGNRIGSGDEEHIMNDSASIIKITIISAVIFAVVMYFSTKAILPIYEISPQAGANVMNITLITSLTLPLRFFAVLLLTGILRGGGDMVFTMFLEMGTMWLIGVPIAAISILVFKAPLELAFALVITEDVIKSFVVFYRYKSKKWIHNLVQSA